jgi:predicted flap endonuclease-1-like 5' DNA nuclease
MLAIFICKNDYFSLLGAIKISRSIECKHWETSSSKLQQIPGLGVQYTKLLTGQSITTFEQLKRTDASKLELVFDSN